MPLPDHLIIFEEGWFRWQRISMRPSRMTFCPMPGMVRIRTSRDPGSGRNNFGSCTPPICTVTCSIGSSRLALAPSCLRNKTQTILRRSENLVGHIDVEAVVAPASHFVIGPGCCGSVPIFWRRSLCIKDGESANHRVARHFRQRPVAPRRRRLAQPAEFFYGRSRSRYPASPTSLPGAPQSCIGAHARRRNNLPPSGMYQFEHPAGSGSATVLTRTGSLRHTFAEAALESLFQIAGHVRRLRPASTRLCPAEDSAATARLVQWSGNKSPSSHRG